MDDLTRAVEVSKGARQVIVATSDPDGQPHVASAGSVEKHGDNGISIREWFCPVTARNLQTNPHAAVVIQKAGQDEGYQLVGRVADVEPVAMLDGYAPGEETPGMPQTEREIILKVEKVMPFSRGPHADAR